MTGERWFDSHCHLQDQYLPEGEQPGGLTAALDRAAAAGVDRLICVGTDQATSRLALDLAAASAAGALGPGRPRVWATVGLHPHDASQGLEAVAGLLEEAASRGALPAAAGECGLDYHYEHSPRPAQRRAFAEQIALASRYGLALVVHARDAWDDLFDVLVAEGVPERTVLHCFTGGPEELHRCLEAGMFVSFSGIVTFKNAGPVREAAALCPADRLLVETDSPFLAPAPHRGRPNEPSFVPLVGAAVAELRGVSPEVVARSSATAAAAVFNL